jgi:hypothetical protein
LNVVDYSEDNVAKIKDKDLEGGYKRNIDEQTDNDKINSEDR